MSVYSTPLICASDDDSAFSEESTYFTPEVSFSAVTPPTRSIDSVCWRSKSTSDVSESVLPASRVLTPLNNEKKDWNCAHDMETRCCSTPTTKDANEFTRKRSSSTPLKCISNIVTPIQRKRNSLRYDDPLVVAEEYEYDKENLMSTVNNSYELTSPVYKNNLLNAKLKRRVKNDSKHKFSFLQRLGVKRKPKVQEYNLLSEEDAKSVESNLSSCNAKNVELSASNSHGMLPHSKFGDYESDIRGKCDKSFKYPVSHKNVVNESYSSVLCREKLFSYSLGSLVKRQPLDDKPADAFPNSAVRENSCQCSSTGLTNQELLSSIMMKLNALEDQIKDIKSIVKNNDCRGKTNVPVTGFLLPPPLPPPPPPPLPDVLFSSTETLTRKMMGLDTAQPAKLQLPAKTHFAITVEDIRSVKLRKTPSAVKRSAVGSPQTPSLKDGVLHSVKFKPVKRSVVQKKEFSNLVSEILSPSKTTDQNELHAVINSKMLEDKDHKVIINNFEVTPVKSKSKNVKILSTKRRDFLLGSPTRKRLNSAHKTLVFRDDGCN